MSMEEKSVVEMLKGLYGEIDKINTKVNDLVEDKQDRDNYIHNLIDKKVSEMSKDDPVSHLIDGKINKLTGEKEDESTNFFCGEYPDCDCEEGYCVYEEGYAGNVPAETEEEREERLEIYEEAIDMMADEICILLEELEDDFGVDEELSNSGFFKQLKSAIKLIDRNCGYSKFFWTSNTSIDEDYRSGLIKKDGLDVIVEVGGGEFYLTTFIIQTEQTKEEEERLKQKVEDRKSVLTYDTVSLAIINFVVNHQGSSAADKIDKQNLVKEAKEIMDYRSDSLSARDATNIAKLLLRYS